METLAWKSIVASGPLAIVLGTAVALLWRSLARIRLQYEGDPDEPEKRPGLIRAMQAEARAREDMIRAHYEQQLAEERRANHEISTRLEAMLRSLAEIPEGR